MEFKGKKREKGKVKLPINTAKIITQQTHTITHRNAPKETKANLNKGSQKMKQFP